MRAYILISAVAALGAVTANPAYSREIRDPEAKFKIRLPDNWSATSQSSRDGSSIFWAFLSPLENFRVLLRTNRIRAAKFDCARLLAEFESAELTKRMPGFVRMPVPDDEPNAKSADECGGGYTGLRKDAKNHVRAYVVFVGIGRKGTTAHRWLAEMEKETFEKRLDEFMSVWDSISYLE